MSNELLRKITSKQVPVSAFIAIGLVIFALLALPVALSFRQTTAPVSAPADEQAPSAPLTSLSRRAIDKLQEQMPHKDVIRALGAPQWAIIPGDGGPLALPSEDFGLELHWNNPQCRDIVVSFDKDLMVIGWDDGSDYCEAKENIKKDQYSCTLPDRQKFCQH